VANGTNATITCSPKAVEEAAAAWPEGEFYVDVTAQSATNLAGCSDTKMTSRLLNVNKKPSLAITPPAIAAVCSDNKALLLSYTLADQANSGKTISVVSSIQSCQATGPNAAGKADPSTTQLYNSLGIGWTGTSQ
jgi:hypothetical protein